MSTPTKAPNPSQPAAADKNTPKKPVELPEAVKKMAAVVHHPPTIMSLKPGTLPSKGSGPRFIETFESVEHHYLGDNLLLQKGDKKGDNIIAAKMPLPLPNGLSLTYGQINWLAGDFFATKNPICLGTTDTDRTKRFQAAFDFLAVRKAAVNEAHNILRDGQAEVDAVAQAVKEGKDPASVFEKYGTSTAIAFEKDTWDRPEGEGYLGLALINFDHFGEDARVAYNTGHAVALNTAAKGDLKMAYALNAFADHFLEDSFSAGHMRVPRRFLHVGGVADAGNVCAKYMHDEDSAIGLSVTSPNGDSWTAFGDKRLLDHEDMANKYYCQQALQQSVKEVTDAFNNRKIPDSVNLVWKIAPTLESARDMSKQKLSPLFTPDGQVRNDISNRADKGHHKKPVEKIPFTDIDLLPYDAWFADIALKCFTSGKWNAGNLHM